MKAIFRVHGRVQGVGYRYHVLREAQALGLGGWVRNDPEGTVSGEAVGDHSRLEALRALLEQGPTYARVSRLDWNAADGGESLPPAFEIRS
jgi:acylphosphatase